MKTCLNKRVILASALLILVSLIPYYLAHVSSGAGYVFGGFLINPLDGNSYLAKMRQGFNGNLSFTLPYTAHPGNGTYINLFYLFLGHIARIADWSLIFTYHFFRIFSLLILVASLFQFVDRILEHEDSKVIAFWLALLGSGMGWLILPFIPVEMITSDFWVSEAYPFLSVYTSPHFTLGMALQIWLLTPRVETNPSTASNAKRFLGALLLALVSPFFVPVVLVVLATRIGFAWQKDRIPLGDIKNLSAILLGALPVIFYDLWIVNSHPVLIGWTAQNVTPAPAWWDILISFSPAFLVALSGTGYAWKSRDSRLALLAIWMLSALIFLSIPFSLQRRFMSGLYVPISGLAAYGWWKMTKKNLLLRKMSIWLFFILVLPTNLVILSTSFFAIQTKDPQVYLTYGEARAFEWIDSNTPPNAVFLASPDTGLFIPAHTHARVIYGHPFETVNAAINKASVNDFFTEWNNRIRFDYITKNKIDYIFIGPREIRLGTRSLEQLGEKVYDFEGVVIIMLPTQADKG